MSKNTKKIQHTINPRAKYFQGYKLRKKIMMWVPPSIEEDFFSEENSESQSIMEFIYYIEASNVERIDTTTYGGSFGMFYEMHLEKYNNPETSFCATTAEGGVSTNYIIDSANSEYEDERTVTLMSVDVDSTNFITEVYALVTFRLIENESDTIMVETLCGNRSLPPSGEGTRLINYLTELAYLVSINKVALHPIDTAIGYYTRLNFIELKKDEADAINDEEDIITFRKNTRARKNWKKAMNAVRFVINENKLKEIEAKKIIIKEFYKNKYENKKGIPIDAPFSKPKQVFVRKPKPVGKLVDVRRNKDGIIKTREVYRIIPGESLRVAQMKREIKEAAEFTKIIRENAKKEPLFTMKEETNSPQDELTQAQIDEEERQNLIELEKKGLEQFNRATRKNIPKQIVVPVVEEEQDNAVYEDDADLEEEERNFQKQEKRDALEKFKEETKKRNSILKQTLKAKAKGKAKRTRKRKPKRHF